MPCVQEDSKYQWVLTLTPKEAAFMAQMPFTVTVPSLNIIIAHAGLVPGVPIAHQRLTDVYRVSSTCIALSAHGLHLSLCACPALEQAFFRLRSQVCYTLVDCRGRSHSGIEEIVSVLV